jgi:hypothetical protein
MAKEEKTGPELIGMIQAKLNVSGVHITVGYKGDGTWTAAVWFHPASANEVPERVAEIVAHLQANYDLKR